MANKFTVGELRHMIAKLPDNMEILLRIADEDTALIATPSCIKVDAGCTDTDMLVFDGVHDDGDSDDDEDEG